MSHASSVDVSAYGTRFDATFPTSGGEVQIAGIDIGGAGMSEAPDGSAPWTVVVDIQAWPSMVAADLDPQGPTLILRVEAAQGPVVAPRQLVLVPPRGIAIPATGTILRASLIAIGDGTVALNQRIAGTLQIRRGQPREFISTVTATIIAQLTASVQIPPFTQLWKLMPTAGNLLNSFVPPDGGKTLDFSSNDQHQIRSPWLPIVGNADSITVTNSTLQTQWQTFAFKGQI